MSNLLQKDQERDASVRNRTAKFQSQTSDSVSGGKRNGEEQGGRGVRGIWRGQARGKGVERRGGVGGGGSKEDTDDGGRKGRHKTLPGHRKSDTDEDPGACQPHDPDLFSYIDPSHPNSLFTGLKSLHEEGLLLDFTITLQGNPFRAHRLVLAAASETPEVFFSLSKQDVENLEGLLTPAGLKAVLSFAYCGDVAMDLTKEGVLEEVLNASRCLRMDRLSHLCTAKVATSAAAERESSLAVIREMWERGVGCDVTIQAESGERYPAHRVVLAAAGDYFRALLCGGLRESSEEVVCLRGVVPWVIESMLGFFYTGRLRLGWGRIWELTEAVFQFQLQGALSLCIDFLQDRMDESSCLDVLVLAETYGLSQLGQAAESYILTHFQGVSAGEKFKDLPCPLLERLLEKDSLCAESEMVVFGAVVSWVKENHRERLPFLPGLLLRVRLPLLSCSELQEALRCSLLSRSAEGRAAMKTLQNLLKGEYRGPECRPRTPNQVLVLVGGDTVDEDFMKRVPSRTLWYAERFHSGPGLIRNIEWRPFAQLPEPARFRHCICILNNKLYVLGGRKYYGALDVLRSAVRFDLAQCKWERLPDMLCQRDYFSAVCAGGKVFALGGNRDDSQYLDVVEYYTPEENTWRLAQPLESAVCGHAAAVLDGQIYISGGCDLRQCCLSSLWCYNPSLGCSPRAPMTVGVGRAGHTMLALGRRLLVAGGLQPLWMGFGDQLLCELYDPTHNSWSSIPALPRPHLSPGATVLDGRLYLVGGSSANTARDTKWVHRYDPHEQCWEKLGAMPHPYTDLAACSLQLPQALLG
ncbi:kelch-like protein 33 [Myripristis murdjan]|uniref:kelch-like protein 33 n=1 Tax=Myripristis murdjan TaxID=586833 RepID=UPI001175FD1E|nr:kelch-like protein 33 [Myripristis murdjan]